LPVTHLAIFHDACRVPLAWIAWIARIAFVLDHRLTEIVHDVSSIRESALPEERTKRLSCTVGRDTPKGNSRFYLADLTDPLLIAHREALFRDPNKDWVQNVLQAIRTRRDTATRCTEIAMEHFASFSPHRAAIFVKPAPRRRGTVHERHAGIVAA
jgi:hypothetical protein